MSQAEDALRHPLREMREKTMGVDQETLRRWEIAGLIRRVVLDPDSLRWDSTNLRPDRSQAFPWPDPLSPGGQDQEPSINRGCG